MCNYGEESENADNGACGALYQERGQLSGHFCHQSVVSLEFLYVCIAKSLFPLAQIPNGVRKRTFMSLCVT